MKPGLYVTNNGKGYLVVVQKAEPTLFYNRKNKKMRWAWLAAIETEKVKSNRFLIENDVQKKMVYLGKV